MHLNAEELDTMIEDASIQELQTCRAAAAQLSWTENTLLRQFSQQLQTCPRSEDPLWGAKLRDSRAREKLLRRIHDFLMSVIRDKEKMEEEKNNLPTLKVPSWVDADGYD